MKVLLIAPQDNKIVPPFSRSKLKPTPSFSGHAFPFGLSYLAAYVQQFGHQVSILDTLSNDLNLKQIKKEIKKQKPDVVGITSMTHYIKSAVVIAKITKNIFPKIPIIIGGPHATFDYQNLLQNYDFDFVVLGEGEITFKELLDCLESKNRAELKNISGIAYKKYGKIIKTNNRLPITKLDNLPLPARELVNFNDYISDQLLPNPVEIIGSRGCSHRCAFCSSSHFWQSWRSRSPQDIVREMKLVLKKYPKTKSFLFYDDNFTLNKDRVIKLCQLMIKEGLNRYPWNCNARADQVDKKMLRLMKKAGLAKINYGVESGSPIVAKNVDKNLNLKTLEKTIKMTKDLGIEVLAFMMIGNPGESKKTIKESISLVKKLKPTTTLWSIAQILPGTKLAQIQPIPDFIKYNYKPEIKKPYRQTWSYIPVFENPDLNREQLKKEHRKILRHFTFYHFLHNPLIQIKHFFYSPLKGFKYLVEVVRG